MSVVRPYSRNNSEFNYTTTDDDRRVVIWWGRGWGLYKNKNNNYRAALKLNVYKLVNQEITHSELSFRKVQKHIKVN